MSYLRGNDEENYRSTEKIYPRRRDPRRNKPPIFPILITIALTLTVSVTIVLVFRPFSQAPISGDPTIQNTTYSNSGTTNCLGYEKTDPEVPDQGKTVTFNVTVPQGCDVIVQGVVGQNVGPYDWNNGAVAALGPGSYSFTIQDGSYQMASDANAHAAFCNAINWIQTNGKALSQTYPLSEWGSC